MAEEAELGGTLFEKCRYAPPLETLAAATGGKVRGLDLLATRMVLSRNHLPQEALNVLLVYFFQTFANKVFDRNDLLKVYDFWLKNRVGTYQEAMEMTKRDIFTVLQKDGPA
ncbi:hypothetical protein [Bacillus sp. B-jedd]|uniref:hypothetical protein n=1 Tax=Bacillus sp. B-jedd TaxID=1476857 RepID=UPI0005155AC0|nr:hypothetical protein [Bacillus sp. B-jedd]CEG27053.1 hypothetical protein BN1002_01909 [Bacillus sp. B-jedd]